MFKRLTLLAIAAVTAWYPVATLCAAASRVWEGLTAPPLSPSARLNGTLTLTINPVNDAPIVTNGAVTPVSEEGLPGGLRDTTGNIDSTDLVVNTGQIGIRDLEGDVMTVLWSPVTMRTVGLRAVMRGMTASSSSIRLTLAAKLPSWTAPPSSRVWVSSMI